MGGLARTGPSRGNLSVQLATDPTTDRLGSPNGARPGCSLVPGRKWMHRVRWFVFDFRKAVISSKSKGNRNGIDNYTYQLVEDLFQQYDTTYIYIYMGSGRFPGPMELLLQQLVRVSKTRWRWFNLNKSMLLQPLIKKLEVLVMINQWTTYCINDNNDERWMVVLIDFYLTFCKN